RLRHTECSGYDRYATHLPSSEKVASVAEIPDRSGSKWCDWRSYRSNSPCCFEATAKICFPSGLEMAPSANDKGPVVRRIGSVDLLKRPAWTGSAEISHRSPALTEYSKYLLSELQ